MEMKKSYASPCVEVTMMEEQDLLTVSGGFSGEDEELLSL